MAGKLLGAAAVILDRKGQVCLVRHSYGKKNWELPGGYSESKESTEQTAVREVWEETGLNVAVDRLAGIYYEPEKDMHHFVFVCRNLDPDRLPKPNSPEITECGYFASDALPRPLSDFTVRRIQEALSPTTTRIFHVIGPRQWFE